MEGGFQGNDGKWMNNECNKPAFKHFYFIFQVYIPASRDHKYISETLKLYVLSRVRGVLKIQVYTSTKMF